MIFNVFFYEQPLAKKRPRQSLAVLFKNNQGNASSIYGTTQIHLMHAFAHFAKRNNLLQHPLQIIHLDVRHPRTGKRYHSLQVSAVSI